MHNLQSQDKPKPGDTGRSVFHWLYLLANSHAACFLVFFRCRCGTHAFGLNGLFAMVMILLVGASAQAPEMFGFFLVWLAFLVIRRAESLSMPRRGLIEHSHYSGWPWLAIRFPFVRKVTTAVGLIEPLFCFLAGAFLLPLSQPLGGFVLLGFVSLTIKAGTERELHRARLRAMRDAYIEQTQLVERFHGQREDF
jgi:hypothetical protein